MNEFKYLMMMENFNLKFGSSDSGLDEYLGSAKGIVIQESTREF